MLYALLAHSDVRLRVQAEVDAVWGQGTLSNFTLQCDPPDYQLVIEHHPTPVPGNHFRVMVAERRFSLFREDGR